MRGLRRCAREHQIERIIAGLPKTLRNEEGPQARRVRRYAAELHAAVNLPIEFWDERFSSVDAEERLAASVAQAAPQRRHRCGGGGHHFARLP